jgi:hypothetical protein
MECFSQLGTELSNQANTRGYPDGNISVSAKGMGHEQGVAIE